MLQTETEGIGSLAFAADGDPSGLDAFGKGVAGHVSSDAESRHPILDRYDALKRRGRLYSTGEEIGNSVTHGVGALLAIAALVLLIVRAVGHGGGLALASALLMGITLVVEYLFSTLYHSIQVPRAKSVFRILDHCAIYLLIAGCYAPFCLVTLVNDGGVGLCEAVWVIAAVGIGVEVLLKERQPKWVSGLIYLAMGWLIVVKIGTLVALLPTAGLWLLVAGGICYSVSVAFYVFKRVPYFHMVFHIFVLAGSICQFLAVVLFVY